MNFKDWAPLKFVDPDLLSQVHLAYVFGKTGQEAFFVTENDEVFACGANYSKCLGLGKDGPQIEPIRVPELCHKKVKGFSCSIDDHGVFVCAYTSDNKLYYWGVYFISKNVYKTPRLSVRKQFNTKVREVVNGPDHCLILTSDGQIFSFGYNKYGQLGRSSSEDNSPALIAGDLEGKIVLQVSCGAKFSVAVLDNGEVYAWGTNSDGQLGVDKEYTILKIPTKVSGLTNVVIKNTICGESYTLAISQVGELYLWGKNDVGQLGLGDTISRFTPTKMETIGKVNDVAASCYGSITAAMNENNEVYMWGACGEMNLLNPTKTQFDSLFDVFAFIANPRIMHKPMFRSFQLDSITESLRNAFGDAETSDLTIVADKKEIFVHKIILKLRSDYFKVFLQKQWLKEDKNKIIINQNYEGLYAYLQYLYFGNLKGSPEVAFESLKIADEYHDLAFKKICEKQARHSITVENVASVYNLALKFDTQDLARHCVLFAGKHIGEIIDTPGFSEWDVNTHKQFIRDCHKQKVFKD